MKQFVFALAVAGGLALAGGVPAQAASDTAPQQGSTMGHDTMGNGAMGHDTTGNSAMGHDTTGHTPMGHTPMGHDTMGHSPMGNDSMGHATTDK